jgi:hypothetical protein
LGKDKRSKSRSLFLHLPLLLFHEVITHTVPPGIAHFPAQFLFNWCSIFYLYKIKA